MDLDFNFCDNLDFNFSDVEDFGMAKCFSKAPFGMMAPHMAGEEEMVNHGGPDENECEKAMNNDIKSDGFTFKLAPTEDVSFGLTKFFVLG